MKTQHFFAALFAFCTLTTNLHAKELVLATTFSSDSTAYIVQQWQQENPEQPIRLINRTSSSLQRFLNSNMDKVDIVMSSSPFLLQDLQQHQRLLPLSQNIASSHLVPTSLQQTTTAVAFSGYGILFNKKRLAEQGLHTPTDWDSLFQPHYYDGLLISSPSRSSTSHLMLEMLLQQRGWQQGWRDFFSLVGNVSLISSRSFNVADRVKMGLAVAGLSIDTYGTALLEDTNLGFVYFPQSVISPTFIAVLKSSQQRDEAEKFIQFLLSEKGQEIFTHPKIAKFPTALLTKEHHLFQQQQKLLSQPKLDYELLLLRQHLVERLFDISITFRLNQLKPVWQELFTLENKNHRQLVEIRNLLTQIPISAEQATDKLFLTRLKQDHQFALIQEKQWADFFQANLEKAISLLEELQ